MSLNKSITVVNKVGVILSGISKNTGLSVFFVGKNIHPMLKTRNLHDSNKTIISSFMLNFPAGAVEAGEDQVQAMYRELFEETGGCIKVQNSDVSSPWQSLDEELLSSTKVIDTTNLKPVNIDPISIEMYNPWKEETIKTNYYFYMLDLGVFDVNLLSEFCTQACKVLNKKDFGAFQEVFEYMEISKDLFIMQLKKLADSKPSSNWFWSNDSTLEPELEKYISFTDQTNTSIAFNKGYFYALCKVIDKIQSI